MMFSYFSLEENYCLTFRFVVHIKLICVWPEVAMVHSFIFVYSVALIPFIWKTIPPGLEGTVQFSHSVMWLLATPWTAACQASLSITNSLTLLRLMPMESEMPSSHLILCRPLHLLPSIFPSIRVFLNESALRIR